MGAATPAARPGPSNFQDVPNVTINGQRTITVLLYNGTLLGGFNVFIKVLTKIIGN